MQLWPTVRAVSALSVLISTGLFVSCGAPRTPEPGEKRPKLTGIRILPAHPTIPKGAILRLRVEGSFDDQTTRILDWFVQWETKRSTIATIDEDGNVKAVEEGVSLVSASYQGLESRTLITVGPPALVGITVSPNQFSLPVGKSEPLTATGNFSDGTTENVTQSATWSSTALASVNTAGTAVALAVGTATINATVGTVTGSANLTVTPPVVTGLNIVPPTLSMPLGTSRQLKAVAGMSDQTTPGHHRDSGVELGRGGNCECQPRRSRDRSTYWLDHDPCPKQRCNQQRFRHRRTTGAGQHRDQSKPVIFTSGRIRSADGDWELFRWNCSKFDFVGNVEFVPFSNRQHQHVRHGNSLGSRNGGNQRGSRVHNRGRKSHGDSSRSDLLEYRSGNLIHGRGRQSSAPSRGRYERWNNPGLERNRGVEFDAAVHCQCEPRRSVDGATSRLDDSPCAEQWSLSLGRCDRGTARRGELLQPYRR